MRLRAVSLFISMLIVLCACDSWPPHEKSAINNFLESRESFEALETKFSISKYYSVSIATGDNAIGLIEVEGGRSREFIDDDPEWARLFKKSQISRVIRDDNSFVFVPSRPYARDGRETEISYTHFIGVEPELKECKPQFEDLRCGVCGVHIESEWRIDYVWYPYPILESEHDKYLHGQLPEEEYFELQMAAFRKCGIEGLKEIGYESE